MPNVLITGSGRRIGRGLALEFARKGFGVVVHYNKSKESAEQTLKEVLETGSRGFIVHADLLDSQQIVQAFDMMIKNFVCPDILINNAGVFPMSAALYQLAEKVWNDTLDINLKAAYLCSKEFSKYAPMGSRIINISSVGGMEIWKHRIPYNVSKAALIRLTQVLARELAPDISVNCISPGAIKIDEEPSENDKFLVPTTRIPFGRYGLVNDIFEAAYFFATCTNYITGQNIVVDGGYHLVK